MAVSRNWWYEQRGHATFASFEDYHTRIKKYYEGAVIWLIDLINVADGSALHPSNITKRFLQYRKEALPHREEISFHSQRRTCASWMVQDGVDLYRV